METITKSDLRKILSCKGVASIDEDCTFKNLSSGYWVYDRLLSDLRRHGWVRFALGFKAGVYGNGKSDYCIKILGMGVGENPLYFCERGEYIAHERDMIADFHNHHFHFLPRALSVSDFIDFLRRACGVDEEQAYLRCVNNDLLVLEYIHSGGTFCYSNGALSGLSIKYREL